MKCFEKIMGLYKNKRELTILQGLYFGVAVAFLVIAGLVALVNQSVGLALLVVPLVSFITFSINTVIWALVKLMLDTVLEMKKSKTKK